MKLNISYPATGCQKVFEVDDEQKLKHFYDKRMAQVKNNSTPNSRRFALKSNLITDKEVTADHLGPEWAGYVVRVTGGNDKQGFPMKQGKCQDSRYPARF